MLIAILTTILGTVIGVLGTHYFQQRRRTLEWTEQEWILAGRAESGRIVISFDGTPVASVFGYGLEVRNVGNDGIPADAFESDIRIHVGEATKVLETTVGGTVGGDRLVRRDRAHLCVTPQLFNPGDVLAVSFLSDREVDLEVEARAVNTKVRWKNPRIGRARRRALLDLALITNAIGALGLLGALTYQPGIWQRVTLFVLAATSWLLIFSYTRSDRQS